MKRIIAFASIFVLVICCGLTAFSVDIDGYNDGAEWNEATAVALLNGESNSKINFGTVKYKVDYETNSLFLFFMYLDPDLTQDNLNTGISLTIENSDPFVLTTDSTPITYDVDKYSFEGAISINETNGALCEIRLGMKYGIPDEINGSVRFIDSDGVPSNVYYFTFINELYAESQAETVKTATTKKSATVKETTTKATTTASTTLRKIDLNIPNFDFLSGDDKTTTKKSETKTTNKKEKTTKSDKTTKAAKTKKSTVKVYEKEVYISIVTEIVENPASEATETATVIQTEDNISDGEISTTQGSKYKTITAICGGIALIAVAVLGTIGSNRKAKKDDPKS